MKHPMPSLADGGVSSKLFDLYGPRDLLLREIREDNVRRAVQLANQLQETTQSWIFHASIGSLRIVV
jgi:hypothetical protein